MDTECSDAESSSSHGVSWSNLTTPCCVQGSRQRHYSRSHDLQNENVLLLVIFQTYGVSSRHDGHSYVCSMGLWFLLRTVCCNCCKRSDTQHSLLCSLCSVSVLQWPQKMTSQCQQWLSFCSIDIFFCHRVDIHQLHRRGYLKQDIASAIDKARQRSRDALLSYRPKSAEVGTILPFVLTYHPDLPKVRDIVDKNWSIIESSDELKDIYQSKPVMAFRRPKSLRDFLVRARLKPNSDDDNQTGECNY